MHVPNDLRRVMEESLGPVKFFVWWTKHVRIQTDWGHNFLPVDDANRLEELRARVALRKTIAERKADDGFIYAAIWQMDCDCASWTTRARVEADFDKYVRFVDHQYECAEGPVRISFITKDEYDNFKSERRDHALEAFENGHSHVVHI